MKCTECGHQMKPPTKQARYHHTFSGLSNLYLNGVLIYECSNKKCDEVEIEIPSAFQLHDVIAEVSPCSPLS